MSIKNSYGLKFNYPANLFPKTLVLKDSNREPEIMYEQPVKVNYEHQDKMGAFGELAERYKKKIYNLSLYFTGNRYLRSK